MAMSMNFFLTGGKCNNNNSKSKSRGGREGKKEKYGKRREGREGGKKEKYGKLESLLKM